MQLKQCESRQQDLPELVSVTSVLTEQISVSSPFSK